MSNSTLKIPTPDEATLQALKDKHGGKLVSVEYLDGEVNVVIRPATTGEWRRFKDSQIRGGESQVKAAEGLARACTVYPAPEQLEQLAGDYAGLLDSLAGDVIEISGVMKSTGKKAL